MKRAEPIFFACAAEFRAWLASNGAEQTALLVGLWKVGTGRANMSWSESVDEALCFGWIDGVRKRIDDQSYQIRFTPRKEVSIWSAINIAKMCSLIESGKMQPAGLEAFKHRKDHKSVVYAYEQAHTAELTAAETKSFMRNKTAWAFFEACPPSYRKPILHWITGARKPDARLRRLQGLVAACARKERLLK